MVYKSEIQNAVYCIHEILGRMVLKDYCGLIDMVVQVSSVSGDVVRVRMIGLAYCKPMCECKIEWYR